MDPTTSAVSVFFASPRPPASRIVVPSPTLAAVSLAMAIASPVTIFTDTPIACAVAIVDAASSRGGSNNGSTPRNSQVPSASVRATPKERKPRAAKSFTAVSTTPLTVAVFSARARMTCGAPLLTLDVAPSVSVTVASVRLSTGLNGSKWVTVQASSAEVSARPPRTARSMGSSLSAREASAPARTTSAALTPVTLNGSPRVSEFWVRVPVLSAQSTSTPASSSMATSLLTMACFVASTRAPTAIVTDSTVGIATGMAATVSTRANCRVVRIGSPRRTDTATITATSATARTMR